MRLVFYQHYLVFCCGLLMGMCWREVAEMLWQNWKEFRELWRTKG